MNGMPGLKLRDLREDDVEDCLSFNPNSIGQEIIGWPATIAVWKSLIGNRAFRSIVAETSESRDKSRIVAFGARMFVARDFADAEIASPQPGLKARLIAGIYRGENILLRPREIGRGNAHGGLDLMGSEGRRPGLSSEAEEEAYERLSSWFFETNSGFWIRRMITEVTNEVELDRYLRSNVWRVFSNFEAFYLQNPGVPRVPGNRLLLITADDTRLVLGHPVKTLFRQKKPVLRLRDGDQQFLAVALVGLTDDELARRLGVSLASVKKRWLYLFEWVAAVQPELFPDAAPSRNGNARGRQKRHLLLAYVRTHAEELAPYEWP
jgi:hypothetical protein